MRSALTSKPDVTWHIAMRSGKRKALNKGHGLLEGGVALAVNLIDLGLGEWRNHCCTLITLPSLNALGLLRGGLYGIAYATAAKTVSVVKHMQPPF